MASFHLGEASYHLVVASFHHEVASSLEEASSHLGEALLREETSSRLVVAWIQVVPYGSVVAYEECVVAGQASSGDQLVWELTLVVDSLRVWMGSRLQIHGRKEADSFR